MLQTRIYVGKYSHLIGEQLDLLRFTVDDKLKVDNHIAEICRNVSQQIAVLKRMRKMLQIRKAINFAFIVLYFNYCADSWYPCSKSSATELKKDKERAIHSVLMDKCSSYRDLLKICNKPASAEQRARNIVGSIFRTIKVEKF